MQFGSLVQMFQSKTAACVFEKFVQFYCATFQYPLHCGMSHCAICAVWV